MYDRSSLSAILIAEVNVSQRGWVGESNAVKFGNY